MLSGYSGDEAVRMIREKRSDVCLCNGAFYDYVVNR